LIDYRDEAMNMPMHASEPAITRALATAVLTIAALLSGCGEKRVVDISAAAAKVNRDEITVQQINLLLQQQRNLRPEQSEAASKQILERLIDQQLALQKAGELNIDREPRVLQQIEAARREIIARAYLEKVGEGAAKPTPEEIRKYYEDRPELFSQRRVYSIQEIAVEARPEQVGALREQLAASQNIGEFVEFLKGNDFRFAANQAVRAAEQLPPSSLSALSKMSDGQALLAAAPNGVQVIVLAGSRSQPVTEEQARAAIEQFIVNERRRKLIDEDVKALRAAAKIEYLGAFAGAASPGAASAPASGAD
jgi:EpsD family peptidyl-prolyl cis-trans isomerase